MYFLLFWFVLTLHRIPSEITKVCGSCNIPTYENNMNNFANCCILRGKKEMIFNEQLVLTKENIDNIRVWKRRQLKSAHQR